MTNYSKELIQDTIKQWSPKAGYTLSEDEAIEIIINLTNFFETLNEIAMDITKQTSKKLIEDGKFVQANDVDSLIPDEIGLYCIKLIENSKLPDEYQLELEKRNSRILYIGKAEKKTLKKRLLNQELRAKGHGTFFRSVGAMLGFRPPEGSLKDKKNQNNYKFSKTDEFNIIEWINSNLEISWIEFDKLFIIEKYLIEMYKPILNIQNNPNPFTLLEEHRKECKDLTLK